MKAWGKVQERRYPRTAVQVPVEFRPGDTMTVYPAVGFMLDLSAGGAFVTTPFPLPRGTEVTLYVLAAESNREDAPLRGIVRWTRAGGMGLQFAGVSEHARSWIAAMVTGCSLEEADAAAFDGLDDLELDGGDRPTRPD